MLFGRFAVYSRSGYVKATSLDYIGNLGFRAGLASGGHWKRSEVRLREECAPVFLTLVRVDYQDQNYLALDILTLAVAR